MQICSGTEPVGLAPLRLPMRLFAAVLVLGAAGVLCDYQYQTITPAMENVAASILTASKANVTSAWDRLAYAVDTFGSRFSGSQGLESTLDWVVATARGVDGLSVIEEPVMVPHWVRGNEWARVTSPRNISLHMAGLGGSIGTSGGVISSQIMVVDTFANLTANCAAAAGKIVVFNALFTSYGATVAYRVGGGSAAAACGAVAALIRSVAPYSMQTPHTGSSGTSPIPSACISVEDATMLARMQQRGQNPIVELYMEAQTLPDAPSRNLIIEIQGSVYPDQYVVVGGHSDSWDIANGAMDDGGGVFCSWEAARLIASLGFAPKRTLRFIFWVNEENGGRGGSAYAIDYNDTLASTSIAIESDEGAFSPYQLTFAGHPTAYNQMTLLAPLLAPLGADRVLLVGGVGASTAADVTPMCSTGVPCGGVEVLDPRLSDLPNNPCQGFADTSPAAQQAAMSSGISDGYFFFHHTATDTIDRMDPNQLQAVAAMMAIWAVTISNLPELLPRDGAVPPVPAASGSSPSGALSPGATAGVSITIVGLAAIVALFWWYQGVSRVTACFSSLRGKSGAAPASSGGTSYSTLPTTASLPDAYENS